MSPQVGQFTRNSAPGVLLSPSKVMIADLVGAGRYHLHYVRFILHVLRSVVIPVWGLWDNGLLDGAEQHVYALLGASFEQTLGR